MKFYVIGIDDSNEQGFSSDVQSVISSHLIFSGGKRHYEITRSFLPQQARWIDITIPLSDVFLQYESYSEIVVFASGDPLFYGFANTIQKMMPHAAIALYPAFNSLQLLAHRLLMPYQDMHIVSLTGRPWDALDEALITGYDKIGILTDSKEHTPPSIAHRMLDYGYDNYRMTVGELLGNKEKEKVSSWELKDILNQGFQYPNNLILHKIGTRPRPLGIPESDFYLLNERPKMITKMPIRLLSLSFLDLRNKSVFWDIGFCTGSVSIEAKLQFPHLQIHAFERRPEGIELIEKNARRFGTPGIHTHIDDFTEIDITSISKPDTVFIGGHGGKINEIITKVNSVLNSNGIVVFNSVSEESKQQFLQAIDNSGMKLEQNIAITIDPFNTIEVLKTIKE